MRFARTAFTVLIMMAALLPAKAQVLGSGTENDPYVISSSEDLVEFRDAINNAGKYKGVTLSDGGKDKFFKLTADIDLKDVCSETSSNSWTPIGVFIDNDNKTPFQGTFQGKGYTISNLYINNPESDYQGLFSYIGEFGSVDNVNLMNVNIKGHSNVGGIVGECKGAISYCSVSGSVSGTSGTIGGMAGTYWPELNAGLNKLIGCINASDVSGASYIGGVVGICGGSTVITDCINSGSVTLLSEESSSGGFGGIVGLSFSITVRNCLNVGSVSMSENGIVGMNLGATVISCYYDKQMCDVPYVVSSSFANGGSITNSEGKLTREMLGEGLKSTLGEPSWEYGFTETNWEFIPGMYPRLKKFSTSDIAIVVSTPVLLANEETSNEVLSSFTLGTAEGVTWERTGDNEALSISDSDVTLPGVGNDVLVAKKNGIVYKTVAIYVPPTLEISSADELVKFCVAINSAGKYGDYTLSNGGKNIRFSLINNIDLSSVCNKTNDKSWIPIGTYTNGNNDIPFQGTFLGNGHTISNLYINEPEGSNIGFFGYIGKDGKVENLELSVDITGRSFVGGVVGRNLYGKIISCTSSGSVSGFESVGGIAGNNCGEISNSINSCVVSQVGYDSNSGSVGGNIGGIAGNNASSIENCISTGSVNGDANGVGGIAGINYKSIVSSFYDKQMCNIANAVGNNADGTITDSEGKLTSEMLGDGLMSFLGEDNWEFAPNMYPRVKGFDESNFARFAATPVLLKNEETVEGVLSNFDLGEADGATWSITEGFGTVSNNTVTLAGKYGQAILLLKDGSNTYKTISLSISNTEANAIDIDNEVDLVNFRNAINNGTEYKEVDLTNGGKGLFFKLTSNIDLSSVCNKTNGTSWIPIGNYTTSFKGTFLGSNKTISNLYINKSGVDFQGLFGSIGASGKVENLELIVNITGETKVGGVAGLNSGEISFCTISGSITGHAGIGGVAGDNYGTVSNCLNSSSIKAITNNEGITGGYVGGVVGANYTRNSKIEKNISVGTLSGVRCVGSVVGYNNQGLITGNYYDKQMSAEANAVGINDGNAETVKNYVYSNEGKLTSEMVSDGAKSIGEDNWIFTPKMYPRVKGLEKTDVAIAAATPILLANEETVATALTNFTVETANDVMWERTGESQVLSVAGNKVTIVGSGNDLLVAKKNGMAYKTIPIVVPQSLTIEDLSQLKEFRDAINNGTGYKGVILVNGGKNQIIKLTANIDLGGSANGDWTPIGNNSVKFQGTFLGEGYTISNLYINKTGYEDNNQGLFGCIDANGKVENLTLTNTDVTGYDCVGGIAGLSYGTVTSCTNNGTIGGNSNIGGIVGENYGKILSSSSNGSITASGGNVGGMTGKSSGPITDCANASSVRGNDNIGGIVGDNSSSISDCSNSGGIVGLDNIGGIVGINYFNSIQKNINSGRISGSNNVGGVIGKNSGLIIVCSNCGSVNGNDNIGGLVGSNEGTVLHGANNGSVKGSNFVGGLFGDNRSFIFGCIASGNVSGDNAVGGVAGTKGNGFYMDCFYDKQMCDKDGIGDANDSDVEGKLTSEMTGEGLKESIGDSWIFAEGLYPRPKGIENTDAALVGAAPVFLAATDATQFETFTGVESGITLGSAEDLTWVSDKPDIAQVSGYSAMLKGNGEVTLTATKGVATKTVTITISDFKQPGTEQNPLTIATAEELAGFREAINNAGSYKETTVANGGEDLYFAITDNINLNAECGATLNSGTSWTPIGTESRPFQGTLLGNGYAISNLYINELGSDTQGLFGTVGANGSIEKVNLVNADVKGNVSVGGIVGDNSGSLTVCAISGSVNGTSYVGSVVGKNKGNITSCISNTSGSSEVGGIAINDGSGTVTNCYYDKQMYSISGEGDNMDGKLTNEMLGESLKTALGETDWVFAEGLYPRLKGSENTDAALVAAMPVFLAATDATNFETSGDVKSGLILSAADDIEWSSSNPEMIRIDNNSATLLTNSGKVFLIVKKGDASKIVELTLNLTSKASVDNVEYFSLQAAINNAAEGQEVSLLDNTMEMVTLDKNIKLKVEEGEPLSLTGSMTVQPEGALTLNTDFSVTGDFVIQSSSSGESQVIGERFNVNASTIYMDFKTDKPMEGETFYGFSLPFNVDLNTGILNAADNTPLASPTQVRVYRWDGSKRAKYGNTSTAESGQNPWQRLMSGESIEAGKAYMIGFTGTNSGNIRFKSSADGMEVNNQSKDSELEEFEAGTGVDTEEHSGWNFVGQPFTQTATSDWAKFVQIMNENNEYTVTELTSNITIAPFSAFFVQVSGDDAAAIQFDPSTDAATLRNSTVSRHYEMLLTQNATGDYDRIYFTASDDATNDYAIGRDLMKMGVSARKPQLYIKEKNSTLCVCDAPIADGEARMALRLAFPTSGSYALSLPGAYDNATVYLSKDGADIWNFANGEYSLTASKGIDSTYALHLVYKSAEVAIELGDIASPAAICSGSALSLNEPSVECNGMQYTARWEISGDSFATATEYMGQPLSETNDGWKIRYAITSEAGKTYYSNEAAIEVNLDPLYLVRLWDDMLVCSNTKSIRFESWQWYKNGTAVSPQDAEDGQFATRPYIRMAGMPSGYQVAATTADGHTYLSCPIKGSEPMQKSAHSISLKTYPNPSPASEPLKVEVVGMEDEMLEGAVLSVFTSTGVQVLRITDVKQINEIRLPQGIYIISLTQNGRTISAKAVRR